jgi:SAM-dependent methyltransferase
MESKTEVRNEELNQAEVGAFFGKVFGDIKSSMLGLNLYIGDKLGLFRALAEAGAVTETEFARRTGLQERYLREWLSAMACGGIVDYDTSTREFYLPKERAFVLAKEDSPVFVSGIFEMLPTFYGNATKVVEHFRSGGGVSQKEYGKEFWHGFERFTRAQFLNHLVQQWIPAMPDVEGKLTDGGSVADVGCGNGQAALILAEAYPKAKVVGYDNYPLAIQEARDRAQRAGLGDRVEFRVADVVDGLPAKYDLVTTFDVIHDMVYPVAALKGIRKSLAQDGRYMWHEFNVSSDLAENIKNPIGLPLFLYNASTNYCMTTSLAEGGAAYGAVLGEKNARKIAKDAGFESFQRLPIDDPFHILYVLER